MNKYKTGREVSTVIKRRWEEPERAGQRDGSKTCDGSKTGRR